MRRNTDSSRHCPECKGYGCIDVSPNESGNFGSFEQIKAAIENGQVVYEANNIAIIYGSGAQILAVMHKNCVKDFATSQPEINKSVQQDFYNGRYNNDA